MDNIGSRLKELAFEKCKSIREFEISCGLTFGVIAKESNIRVDNLAKILEKYPDIDIKYILTGVKTINKEDVYRQRYNDVLELMKIQLQVMQRLTSMIK